jgi:Tol biopolymer transport system component
MIGSKIGLYEITALLGKGGMGEVYRGRDTKLKRDVAIKILPEEFSRDADRVSRFQREAEVLAALNHPNIGAIYDLQETESARFLVLELVDGETLAERIERGPIPIDEALPIAKSICEALEAAHEQGIVHRDLKPANVKVTPDGKVKVLDFGLAKAIEQSPATILSHSPTLISVAASNQGMILGTAAYMSPEQAKGKSVDKRADIWAFGVVLYEMLTGRMLFSGETVSETMAFVMTKEPDWNSLPAATPAHIRELLRRCLVKDPRNRIRDIGDVRIALETVDAVGEQSAPETSRAVIDRAYRIASILLLIATLAFSVPAIKYFRQAPLASPPEMRVEIITPPTGAPLEFALSPDGRYIVFVASGEGAQRLWLRALDKTDAQPMAGTEGVEFPFWSADSRSIGFTAAGKLKRIDIAGGPPQILANTAQIMLGAWNLDGTIVFNAVGGPLSRISASGGEPVPVTRLDLGRQVNHRLPRFLPDGRHFLFYALGSVEAAGIYLASLDGGEPKRLGPADSAAEFFPPDMIAFVRGTSLMVQRLDLKRSELIGEPVRLADPVGVDPRGNGGFSTSADGLVAYRGGGGALRQLRWYDRTGKVLSVVGQADPASPLYPELSPDGARLALYRLTQTNADIWLADLARGGLTRFTFDPAIDTSPVWSGDGMRIAFESTRKGSGNLYTKPSSGAGIEELLLESPNQKAVMDWSKDGRYLLYYEADPKTGRDLWALPMVGNDRKPIVIVKTPFEETNGQFSPDGRWVAYETNESGRPEIVVQPFPVPTGKWQVSTGGGIQPRWRADGKELYFVAPDGKLMAVSIRAADATFSAGTPMTLFQANLAPGAGTNKQQYAVSRDGRFLINQPAEASTSSPITLILNWHPPKS